MAAELGQERHQWQQAEAETETLALAHRKDLHRLRIGAGLLAASSLVAVVAIHSAISSSRMAYQSQQELSLQLQRLEDERNLAQQASRIPLTAPNQLNPSAEGMSLEEQGQAVVRQSAQYPGQVQTLVEALQLGYALKAQLPAANAQSDRLTMHNYPAYSPMLALRMTTSSLMQRPDESPRNAGASQAETPGGAGSSTLPANGAALFDLVEHPFVNELFVAWSPDGQGLATYSERENRSYLRSPDGVEQASFEGAFHGFTPDGQGVLTVTEHNDVRPDDQNGVPPESVPTEIAPPEASSEPSDARFRLWSLDGVEMASFEGNLQGVTPDGQGLLIFTQGDDTLRLWGFDGQERASFEGEFKQFAPDGQGVMTIGNGKLRLYNLDGVEQASFEGALKGVSPDGQGLVTDYYLLSSSRLGRWWNPGGIQASQLWNLDGAKRAVVKGYFQSFTPDSQRLVTVYPVGGEFTLWDAITWGSGPSSSESQPYESYVWSLDGVEQARVEGFFRDFTPDGQGLITTQVSREEKGRWGTLMNNLRSHLKHRNAAFASMMMPFDPDDPSPTGISHLWNLNGKKQASFEGDFVSFTPDGQGLVTNYYTGDSPPAVYLWSLAGEKLASFEGSFASFTPDGQGLVTRQIVDGQRSARLWNLNGEEQASFAGSFRNFIPNRQGLITDFGNDTILLWTFQGELLAEVTGFVNVRPGVWSDETGFSDDGRFLITALAGFNQPPRYRIWPMDNGLDDLLSRGCNLLSSHFRANPGQREDLGICLDQPL